MNQRREHGSAAEDDAERRRILRQVTLWMWIYGSLAVGLAIGSGAVVAWLLHHFGGLPFRATWLAATVVIAGVPVLIHLVQAFRRKHREQEPGSD